MIPKIVHLTAKDKNLVGFNAEMLKKIVDLHPSWEVRVWDDGENEAFVRKSYPEYLEAFKALPFPVMRADMVRYMYMLSFGGWYMDTDYELVRALDELKDYSLILPKSRDEISSDGVVKTFRIGNAVFASEPGQQFWGDLLSVFFSRDLPPGMTKDRVEEMTGPEFVTEVYLASPNRYEHAYLPERNLFHPDAFKTRAKDAVRAGYYGIHHCSGTWRDKNLVSTMKGQIKYVLGRVGL